MTTAVPAVEKKIIDKCNREIQITIAFNKKIIIPSRYFILTEDDLKTLKEEDILQK